MLPARKLVISTMARTAATLIGIAILLSVLLNGYGIIGDIRHLLIFFVASFILLLLEGVTVRFWIITNERTRREALNQIVEFIREPCGYTENGRVYVNQAYLELVGKAEVMDTLLYQTIHPEDLAKVQSHIRVGEQTGVASSYKKRLITDDQRELNVSVLTQPILIDGRFAGRIWRVFKVEDTGEALPADST